MSQQEKHARRPNWTEDEILLMCKFIEEKKNIIRAKFSSNVSTQCKKAAWEYVTAQLNASNPSVKRERTEVEKKWHNVHSKSKKELTEHSKNSLKTGGGPPPKPLGVVSQAVADIIGEENVCIQGIGDILDSSYFQVTSFNDERTTTAASDIILNLEDICVLDSTVSLPVPAPTPVTKPSTKIKRVSTETCNDDGERKKIKLETENLMLMKENLLLKNEYLKLKLNLLKQKMVSPEN